MTGQLNLIAATVDVLLRGPIPPRAKEYVREKLISVIRFSPMPVARARAVLTQIGHRGTDEHVLAEAVLDVNGRLVRAHVAASTSREAVDLIQARLRRKLCELSRHTARGSGRTRSHRPGFARRPAGERELVRRKTFQPAVATVHEAVFDMEMMDFDFQLFTDVSRGADGIVYRSGADGYRVTWIQAPINELDVPREVTADRWPAPRLTLEAAVSTMDAGEMPFLFYADKATGRGCVLYLRHDGHYGLITPADSQ